MMKDQIAVEQFHAVEIRVGRIVEVEEFPKARKPSYRLLVDFGQHGRRRSVAALRTDYELAELQGRQVVCVVNLPPRRIAGVESEELVLAATEQDGTLRLLGPSPEADLGSIIT